MLSAGVRLRGVNILHAMENSWGIPCQTALGMKEVYIADWRPKKVIGQASHKWISSSFELNITEGREMGVGDERSTVHTHPQFGMSCLEPLLEAEYWQGTSSV